jgi:hypothetical protein
MNIVDRLHKRIQDFESVLEATKDVSWDEAFIVNFWYLSNLKEIKYLRYVS